MTAAEGETRVDVTLPGDRKCDVTFGRIRLFCGDVIRLRLLPFETASFSSRSDLSGTTVVSSTGKVAVFAGNSGITVGPGNVTDQTMSQLLPVTQWGSGPEDANSVYDYAIPSIPENDQSGYSVRVSSGDVNTSVAVTTGDVTRRHVLLAGHVLTLDFADNAPALIRGREAPLQVVQFVGSATVPSDSGAPASQIVPERRRYASFYAFTNPPGYVHYVIVVMESNTSRTGLVIDDVTVEADDEAGWRPIGGTTLVTKGILMMRDGFHTVTHRSGVKFGAFRYTYIRGNCAYAYPAGVATETNHVSVHHVTDL